MKNKKKIKELQAEVEKLNTDIDMLLNCSYDGYLYYKLNRELKKRMEYQFIYNTNDLKPGGLLYI